MPRRPRVLLTVLVLLAALGTGVRTASASVGDAACDSYADCNAQGLTTHDFEDHNSTSYWGQSTPADGHNCTNYAAYVESTVFGAADPGALGNAKDWGTNVGDHGTVDDQPSVGSVAWWSSLPGDGGLGHVAIVESFTDSSVTVSEDNFNPEGGHFDWRTYTTDGDPSSYPTGFIHFNRTASIAPTPTPTPTPTADPTPPPATLVPALSFDATGINVGDAWPFQVQGTPGDAVTIWALTPPSATYAQVRSATFDDSGTAGFAVTPRFNTSLFARTSAGDSAPAQVYVRPAEALDGDATGTFGSFDGQIVPGHAGVRVRLFTVKLGRVSLVGQAVTDDDGRWTYARDFAASGPISFIAQTVTDDVSLSGQSNRVTVRFG